MRGHATSTRKSRPPRHGRVGRPHAGHAPETHRAVLSAGGGRHTLRLKGQGSLPPVVILHDSIAPGLGLAPLMFALQPHFSKVRSIDLRDHRGSPRRAYETVVATLRTFKEPALLVGAASGESLALWISAKHPELVWRMVAAPGFGTPATSSDPLQQTLAALTELEERDPGRLRTLSVPGWIICNRYTETTRGAVESGIQSLRQRLPSHVRVTREPLGDTAHPGSPSRLAALLVAYARPEVGFASAAGDGWDPGTGLSRLN